MDGFKGKFTGNHGFYHEIWGFPFIRMIILETTLPSGNLT